MDNHGCNFAVGTSSYDDLTQGSPFHFHGQSASFSKAGWTRDISPAMLKSVRSDTKGEINMSQAYMIHLAHKIIVASDSRMSIYNNGNWSYLDKNKKIWYLPQANLVCVSTGPNSIQGQTIRELCQTNEAIFSAAKSLKDNAQILSQLFQPMLQKENLHEIINFSIGRIDKEGKAESIYFDVSGNKEKPVFFTDCFLWSNNANIVQRLFADVIDIQENSSNGNRTIVPQYTSLCFPQASWYTIEQWRELLVFLIQAEEKYQAYRGLPRTVGGNILFAFLDSTGYHEEWIEN